MFFTKKKLTAGLTSVTVKSIDICIDLVIAFNLVVIVKLNKYLK